MKKYLFVFALLASVLSFSACSDDDDDIDVNRLEGNWGLIQAEGYRIENGEKDSWNDSYDPANPTNDSEKITVSKIADKTYSVTSSYYYGNKWNQSGTNKFTLDGSNLIPENNNTQGSIKILTATSDKLVIEAKGKDEDGDFYNKMTYKRI